MDVADDSEQCWKVIDSIPHWTPHVKKLFLEYEFAEFAEQPLFHQKLLKAVWNNLHLQ